MTVSTDDDHIVKYQWEQVSGPLNSHKQDEDVDLEQTMLVLKGLGPGNYTFKLVQLSNRYAFLFKIS